MPTESLSIQNRNFLFRCSRWSRWAGNFDEVMGNAPIVWEDDSKPRFFAIPSESPTEDAAAIERHLAAAVAPLQASARRARVRGISLMRQRFCGQILPARALVPTATTPIDVLERHQWAKHDHHRKELDGPTEGWQ